MGRCQHCQKLTHSEHVNVYFHKEELQKIQELQYLDTWATPYQYACTEPHEIGKLKCGDIIIHFLVSENE